jgi:hypothetical protein
MIKRKLRFGSIVIDYGLQYSNRKSLGITVTPEMSVIVSSPEGADLELIEAKLIKRAPWIIRNLSYFLSFHPKTPQRKYVSGETHLYLGRQYLMKILESEKEFVKLNGKYLVVGALNPARAKALVENWYVEQARIKLKKIATPLIENFKKYQVQPTSLEIRSMTKRWGSCTADGKIILNPELIKAPKGSIEYVIIHELCHLIHHDHTRKFFDLQSKEMKDWEKWKNKLETLLV